MRMRLADILLTALMVILGVYGVYRITTGLDYRWNWGAIPQYILRYDAASRAWVPNLLLQGLVTTIRLSVWASILAVFVGTLIGLFRLSSRLFWRLLGRTYVELVRSLPPLVMIFVFYYFIGDQITTALGVEQAVHALPKGAQDLAALLFAPPSLLSPFLSALLALAFFEGAFIAEIVRAGIQSIQRGQWEASYALGLSRWQQLRHVILPQVIPKIMPPLAGQFISTVKDSAIVAVISIQELTFQGMELMSATFLTFEVWIAVAAMYFGLTFPLSLALRRLEGSMGHRHGYGPPGTAGKRIARFQGKPL
jgi:polar amino acid transport system permease protein